MARLSVLAVVSALLVAALAVFGVVQAGARQLANAAASRTALNDKAPAACSTLSGVNLMIGSSTFTTASNELSDSDEGDLLYGNGISPDTVLDTVNSPTSASMSNPSTASASDTTLTMCRPGAGSITCDDTTGILTFTPGLSVRTKSIKETLDLTLAGCTTSPGAAADGTRAVPHTSSINAWTSTIAALSLSCKDFEVGTSYSQSTVGPKGKISWNSPAAPSSDFSFPGFSLAAPNGQLMLNYPATGENTVVKGGFKGSYAVADLIANPNELLTSKCESLAGLRAFSINVGTVTFGQPSS